MMHMEPWKIVDKLQKPDPWSDGTHLVLVVEKDGKKREVTVTGFTWDRAEVGKEVELPR